MSFNDFRIRVADFLNDSIIDLGFLFINFWHIVHFFSGLIVMVLILRVFRKMETKEKFVLLLLFLSLYEVFEFAFIVAGSSLFLGETAVDVFWDLVVGMLGGFVGFKIVTRKKKKR